MPRTARPMIALLVAATVSCKDDEVDLPGDDTGVPGPVCTSDPVGAVAAAQDDDTITLCAGTYTVNLEVGIRLSIVGEEGSSATVLDGGGNGPVVKALGGLLTLQGLTLLGGSGFGGRNDSLGGGLYAEETDLTLVDVVVTGNSAAAGGGIAVIGGTALDMTDVLVEGNSANYAGGLAVRPTAGTVAVDGHGSTIVSSNTANTTGGGLGVECKMSPQDVSLSGVEISGNVANYGGGGSVSECAVVTLEQLSVDANEGTSLAGGLILWTRGDVALHDVEIRGNSSGEYGDGGLHFQPLEDALTVSATDSVVDGNQGGEGGGLGVAGNGLYGTDRFAVTVEGFVVTNNAGTRGGGLWADAADLTLLDTTWGGNTADQGGALYLLTDTTVTGGAITGNVATVAGGGVYLGEETVSFQGVDLGEGGSDNEPDDVYGVDGATGSGGAAATLACTTSQCS